MRLLNHRHLYGCSVERMILERTLVLVLLVSGELEREDYYNCNHFIGTHNTTHCGVVVFIYRTSHYPYRWSGHY